VVRKTSGPKTVEEAEGSSRVRNEDFMTCTTQFYSGDQINADDRRSMARVG
jgi:hypothetical protein